MLEFKKYSSIENSFNREFMERIVAEMPTDLEYVVQEKVHGANTSFLCDGEDVRFAKRTSMLEAEEKFYDYPELLERYKDKVMDLTKDVISRYEDVRSVNVFGEMFGGTYPHKDVQPNRKLSLIQKGVCYTPEHEFYGFDIYVMGEGVGRYLPVDEVNELLDKHGFFYARTLFKGTLAECLKHPNAFQSKIAEWLGFPAIEDNICEGIVIRPVVPMYLRNGSRVLIKSKNERFDRKDGKKVHMQTLCGISHFDYRLRRAYSYEQASNVMRALRLTYSEARQMFRRMVFNVVIRNQDDHTKNISFLMEEDGKWHLSPAYDMGYAYNPNGGWTATHQMSINEKFDNITRNDLLEFASKNNIKDATSIIDDVCETASHWKDIAKDCGVPSAMIDTIIPQLLLDL